MPAKDGKLSAEEKQTIVDTLNGYETANGRELVCDVCTSTLWFVNDYLLGMPSDTLIGPMGPWVRTPSVSLICSGCGQMKLFASGSLGVNALKADEPQEPQEPPSGD